MLAFNQIASIANMSPLPCFAIKLKVERNLMSASDLPEICGCVRTGWFIRRGIACVNTWNFLLYSSGNNMYIKGMTNIMFDEDRRESDVRWLSIAILGHFSLKLTSWLNCSKLFAYQKGMMWLKWISISLLLLLHLAPKKWKNMLYDLKWYILQPSSQVSNIIFKQNLCTNQLKIFYASFELGKTFRAVGRSYLEDLLNVLVNRSSSLTQGKYELLTFPNAQITDFRAVGQLKKLSYCTIQISQISFIEFEGETARDTGRYICL